MNLIISAELPVPLIINLLLTSFCNYTIRVISNPKTRSSFTVKKINAIFPIDMWKEFVPFAVLKMQEVISVTNAVKFTKLQP